MMCDGVTSGHGNGLDLMRSSGRDEDGLALALHKVPAAHAAFLPEATPQVGVEVEARVMHRMREL